MSERIYRDPVHNIIRLRTDSDEGKLIMHLIDTPEFQRLRRIKQLGLGLYTYQGAEHSRFTHSLGAFHLMSRVLDRLSEKHHIDKQDHAAARAAALLHDVGHGSFSHVMEKVLGFHHEKWTVEVVLSEETEVGQRLRSHSADLPAKVAAIIEGKFQPAALAQLVSSEQLPSISRLNGSFAGTSANVAAVLYLQSLSFVEYLLERYQFYRMNELLDQLGRAVPMSSAFENAFQEPLDDAEGDWRKELTGG